MYDEKIDGNVETRIPYVIKRSGARVPFNRMKIVKAITGANNDCGVESDRLEITKVQAIADGIEHDAWRAGRDLSVEEIQDRVEDALISAGKPKVAKAFILYRYRHAENRKMTDIDKRIESVIKRNNEEVNQENSNKNPTVLSTQRDYMAGEWDRYYVRNFILPDDIMRAHDEGVIHVHDTDYIGMSETNCCLINLKDMLENGTAISGTHIDPPKSFATACTVMSQISAAVASSQYGGQTMSLAHLAPFVDVSRQKLKKRFAAELPMLTKEQLDSFVEKEVIKEVEAGCQTIQYQEITLSSTNGQAPFITLFMYLDEVPEGQTRDDLALIIKIMLEQRMKGVKDRTGHYVTPAFPKLIYALDEDNIHEGSKYYYLTKLAAECTAKRMVPDYISAKIMRQLKGDTYPCMGCVDGREVITYKYGAEMRTESFERAWEYLRNYFPEKTQMNGKDKYMDLQNVFIYDQKVGMTPCYRMIRNFSDNWVRIKFTNGRTLECTTNHPFETENRGVVHAADLLNGDIIKRDMSAMCGSDKPFNVDRAWLLGMLLCDSTYESTITVSVAATGEDDIAARIQSIFKDEYGLNIHIIVQNRGPRGNYKDIRVESDGNHFVSLKSWLVSFFGGRAKATRHIPNEVFNWNKAARLAFLAGMIDADGYINNTTATCAVQIGSTNKELALQQVLLAQSLGMQGAVYLNHYRSNSRDNIRYTVEFTPSEELVAMISCKKKLEHVTNITRKNNSIRLRDEMTVAEIEPISAEKYSYDVTTASEHFTVSGIYSHNCRSFLTPDNPSQPEGNCNAGNIAHAGDYFPGQHKYYGRFNQGVVTINLVDVACSAVQEAERNGTDKFDTFWKIFDERLELCHKALQIRHNTLLGTPSDVAPILWQDGALARLKPGETIDKLLYGNYSTISLGYAGLYEACVEMTGKSHTDPSVQPFAMKVMHTMNDKCTTWRAAENISYSLYGTPLESTTYKFAKCLQRRFGKIKDVADHNYITNSYHVNVREPINAFDKLTLEAEFQQLSPGGAVSYVEVPNMQNNIQAVLALMKHIYNTIMYAELNTKSDYCDKCGYDGEIQIVKDDTGKLIWKCPNCGCTDQRFLHVARRTCGYIGTQFWNQGRTEEIAERVLHL